VNRTLHSDSSLLMKLLHAKMQDGRPAFNVTDLRRLSISSVWREDENIRYLLQNAKSLEKLDISVEYLSCIVGLLSPSARTLKVLDLSLFLYSIPPTQPLAGVCEEFEAMAGYSVLEALSLEVKLCGVESEDSIGTIIQKVEEVLVKPGWSALKQVSFKVNHRVSVRAHRAKLEMLLSLPKKYLIRLPELESVAFNYSAKVYNPI
jgi:hypothetical protein